MDEYIIINKTAILKGIEEWEIELQECYKASIGKYNSDYVSTLQQAITTAREILSQSTPLIPEIEKAFDAGRERGEYGYGDANNKQEYISSLKLDI